MPTDPYANATSNFRIPYMSPGERSSGMSNKRAALIVDKQLEGAARLIGTTGIIADGAYTAVFVAGGSSSVTAVGTPTNYAIEAVINGIYVANGSALVWTNIPDNSFVYLYVYTAEQGIYTSQEFSSLSSGMVLTTFNTNGMTPANSIFVGTATTTGSSITLDISSSAHDNDHFPVQRPTIYPYTQHRLQVPIDHPDGSIISRTLTSNIIRSQHIAPWDGYTSGLGVTGQMSGTGVNSQHLKPQAVTSEKIAPSVSISGLEIQQALTTLQTATSTFSGLTIYARSNPQLLTEVVNLQVLQQATSGLTTVLQSEVNVLGNNFSGLDNRTQSTQGRLTADELLLQSTVANQSGVSSTLGVVQTATTVLVSNYSGLDSRTQTMQQIVQRGIAAIVSGTGSLTVLYPQPFASNPSVSAAVHRSNTLLPTVMLTSLFSGNSGGFGALFSGVATDSSTYTLHWNAGTF